MVITRLQGGLGNQLFQYAVGLTIALRKGTNLQLDLSLYRGGGVRMRLCSALRRSHPARGKYHRTYALDKWNVDAHCASFSKVKALELYDRILFAAKPKTSYFDRPVVFEKKWGFDPAILNAPRNCLLIGWWQSEKFFTGIEPRLRREFTPRFPLSPHAKAMAERIRRAEASIFIHVRRGDYLSLENFAVCSLAYYQRAISYLERQIGHARFFIFSDDPEWAQKYLAVDDRFTVVTRLDLANDSSTGYEHEDLWLMGLCRHGIISNSSFSWWGAWLSAPRGGMVIAPDMWFPDPGGDSQRLIPEKWIRIATGVLASQS